MFTGVSFFEIQKWSFFPSIVTEDLSEAENGNLEAQDADDQVPGLDEDGNNDADFTRQVRSKPLQTLDVDMSGFPRLSKNSLYFCRIND